MRRFLSFILFVCCLGMMSFAEDAPASAEVEQQAEIAAVITRNDSLASQAAIVTGKQDNPEGGWLANRGITLSFGYTAEMFGNLRGGLDSQKQTQFLGSARSSMTLDFSKLHFGRGEFYISGQSLHGRGINDARVGAVQNPSSLDEVKFNKLVEAWYSDTYFDDKLTVKIGRQYADADFNVIENGAEFVNSSYGKNPTILLPTYPSPHMGVSAWITPAGWISVGAGIYRGSELESPTEDIPTVDKGTFTLAEVKVQPTSGGIARNGIYRFGVWRQQRGTYLADASSAVTNYGVYFAGDYWLRKPDSAGHHHGPGLFFQWGWAPADRNELRGYWGAGIAYPGLLRARPDDSIGFGITQARLADNTLETIPELYYKWQVTKHFSLQPDLQWVCNPSGNGRNTLLGGVRMGFQF